MDKISDVKLIFIDIDGTLINSEGMVSRRTKKALSRVRDKDINCIITSGRPNSHTKEFALSSNASAVSISCNGALVYDNQNNEVIFKSVLAKKHLNKVWNICEDNGISCLFNTLNCRYANKHTKFKENVIFIDNIDEIKDEEIFQAVIVSTSLDGINDVNNYVTNNADIKISNASKSFYDQTESNYYFIDIVNIDVDKGTAVMKLQDYFKMGFNNSMCFGDSLNDIPMFKKCKYSVAMKNARSELFKYNSYITLSNDEDGVADFIENAILGEKYESSIN